MKLKTLKQNDKIRLTVNGTSQSLTVKQALNQFLDGGIVSEFIQKFDELRYKQEVMRSTGLLEQYKGVMIQIDLY